MSQHASGDTRMALTGKGHMASRHIYDHGQEGSQAVCHSNGEKPEWGVMLASPLLSENYGGWSWLVLCQPDRS